MPFAPVQVSVEQGRVLLSPGHPDVGGDALLKVRDKISFHWDPHAFRELVAASQSGVLDLWTVSGEPLGRVFTSAAHAIAQFTLNVASDGDAEKFVGGLLSAVTTIGHVVEAACLGLILETGEADPRKYILRVA